LFTRWIQLGIFHPFCRVHSSGDHGDQEPWAFDDDVTDIVRKFIELRYQLLPYLYTAFWHYIDHGTPILKSLVLYDQEDVHTHYRTDEFIFGEKILVCPIIEPNAKGRRMYIPNGNWFNYWTDKIVKGGREIWVDADIDSIPMFIKEGAIIPKYPVQQYVGEKDIKEVTLDVFFKKGKERSQLFDDAHDGYDYTKGRFSLRTFKFTGKQDKVIIQQHKEGKYTTSYDNFKIRIHGLPFDIVEIELDNEIIPLKHLKMNGTHSMIVDKNFSQLHIKGKIE